MAAEVTYLELSETDGSSHKFYEVAVEHNEVRIRYGRIGDSGQLQVKTYPTPEQAIAEAAKKIKEKTKKGYEPAVIGLRQKRTITRRQITSTPSVSQRSPALWKFDSGSAAFGIFVDPDCCWIGNQAGRVLKLDHQGAVLNQYQLPEGVKCIVADDMWIYAGCDNGNVYDLTGKLPRLAYEIDESVDIYWLDIANGTLGVSDTNGGLVTINPEGEEQWTRLSQGKWGWMVRADGNGFYHGHSAGVTNYDLTGQQLWHQPTGGAVLFGWQEENMIYAGTSNRQIQSFTKSGEVQTVFKCNASVYSCATAPKGQYVFAGDSSSSIYCFDSQGQRLWKLGTGCGSALSMQFFGDRLYIVTTDGSLACIDVSANAIESSQAGNLPQTKLLQAPPASPLIATTSDLETTTDTSEGVILECFRQGGKLRVRVISTGYKSDWLVQFPRDIRQEGKRYWVQEVKESAQGGFYRTYGDIKQLG